MTPRESRRPSFFWQGVLILCPALALACFVLFALQRESRFSQQEIILDATRLSQRFNAKWNAAMESKLTALLHFQNQPLLDPLQDPISLLQNGNAACLAAVVNSSNALLYPSRSKVTDPYDFPEDQITRSQLALYRDYSEFVLAHGTNSEPKYQALISSGAGEPWLSNAKYQHSVALSREGDLERAGIEWMEIIRNRAPIPTRSGWPVQIFAAIQAVRFHLNPSEQEEAMNRASSLAIYSGMAEAEYILTKLESSMGTNAGSSSAKMKAGLRVWESVRKTHERICEEFAALPARPITPAGVLELQSGPAVVWTRKEEDKTAVLLQNKECLTAEFAKAAEETELPSHFGIRMVNHGVALWDSFSSGRVTELITSSPGSATLEIDTLLIDPTYRFHQLTRRLMVMAGLCVAELVILIGFLASWRAFKKQLQISEMRSNFVSSVSHELRAPIASLRLMSEELTLDETLPASKSRQYHSLMTRECQRLSRLIDNVLNFSRQDSGKQTYHFEIRNLNTVITSAAGILEPTIASAELKVNYQLEATQFPAADSSAFTQIVINLLENAIKHSQPGKSIELKTVSNDQEFIFSVTDHGTGIPLEEQKKIFEQFYRPGSEMRRETQGVGLGLAIVENICVAHGAKIQLKSKPGEGSAFSIHFPLHSQKPIE